MRILVVTAMYPTPDDPAFGSFVRRQMLSLEAAGVEVDVLVLSGRSRKLAYAAGVRELHERLRRRRFDVVHAHYGLAGMVARAQRQVPVVVTFHGDDLLGTATGDGRTTRLSRALVAAGRILSDRVDGVIVQSHQMAGVLRRRDVHVISSEVDFDVFAPVDRVTAWRELGLDPERRYLLFAAKPEIA